MADAVVIKDALGRELKIRELSVVDQMRLMRAMGRHADTETYANSVNAIAMVAEIDGVPRPVPSTQAEIDAAAIKVGKEGLAAIVVYMQELHERTMEEAEAANDPLARAAGSSSAPTSSG